MDFLNCKMQDSTLILLGFITTFIVYHLFNRKNKLPPGPWGLPILGNFLQFSHSIPFHKTLSNWANIYGPIFKIKLGTYTTIVLNDTAIIREAFSHPSLNGRPTDKFFRAASGGNFGVIGTHGDTWSEQRKFSLRHLRNFGFGKNQMESLIVDEAKELIENFINENEKSFNPSKRFSLAVLNSLWFIVTGERFKQNDQKVQQILETFFRQIDDSLIKSKMSYFPLFAKIAPEWSGYNKLKGVMDDTLKFFSTVVTEHEKTREAEPRDFIDAYLAEINKANDNPNSSFHQENGYKHLLTNISDFFAAGAETTSTALSWAVLYLATYPDLQKRLQEEIDRVIGHARLPSLSDRANMPFSEALMLEIFRKCTIGNIGLFHRATEDVNLAGYHIPKNSFLISNFHHCHNNPKYWLEPEKFNPDRFLVNDKNGNLKIQKNSNLMPFSVGKRACLGESLAKDEFFLFLTSIYQKMNVILDPSQEPISLVPNISFLSRPAPFKVIMNQRNV